MSPPLSKLSVLIIGLALSSIALSLQAKPVILVKVFTTSPDVTLPYDMKLLQTQLVESSIKLVLAYESRLTRGQLSG